MQRLLSAILIFLLCSGFLGGQRWDGKYGITNEELKSIEVIPKLLVPLNSGIRNDVINAAEDIEKFGKKASSYFGELVKVASSDECAKNGYVFLALINSAMTIYNEDNENDLELLLYLGISHPNDSVRNTAYRYLSKTKIHSQRLIDSLELLSKNEPNAKVRRLIVNAMSNVKFSEANHELTKNKKPVSSNNITANNFVAEQNNYAIAVIIGNMNYASTKKSVPNVDYAINDAKAIKDILVNVKGYREGNIIYFENATQADIVSTFGNKDNFKGKLFNWVRPESDVFVYYSGHGAPSLKDGAGYLLPVDSDPSTVELNGYPLDTLYQNIGKLQAKSITIVIDACFSGSSQGGTITKNASSISLKPITMPKAEAGINVLAAANVGEVASWDTDSQHSLFTSYFIKALNGAADKRPYGNEDRQIDLAEVQKFVNLEVTYMARRNYGRDQNPQISGNPGFVFSTLKE